LDAAQDDELTPPTTVEGGRRTLNAWRAWPGSTWTALRRSIGTAVLIAVAGFAGHLALELTLHRLHVFDQHNVLFDADPNEAIDVFARGGYTYGHRQGMVHPALRVFFTAPIKIGAILLTKLTAGTDVASMRLRLTLLLAPTAAALFYFTFHQVLRRLRLSQGLAALGTVLALVSFGQLLFGSVPESYVISNLLIAIAFWLAVASAEQPRGAGLAAWIALGLASTGVTVTNIVPISAIFWMSELTRSRRMGTSVVRAILMAAVVLMLALGLNLAVNRSSGATRPLGEDVGWATAFVTTQPTAIAARLATFPALLVDSIVAPVPRTIPNDYAILVKADARYRFQFTFDSDGQKGTTTSVVSVRNVLGTGLVVLFAWTWWSFRGTSDEDGPAHAVCGAALLILAFNAVLHSFWGLDRFLYSQHWDVALKLLIVMSVVAPRRRTSRVVAACLLGVAVIVANNAVALHSMLATLRSAF
jgi:hypothetical protein